MSVTNDIKPLRNLSYERKRKRPFLSPQKKFQIFLESHTGKTPVGELFRREGIYSTDLACIRQKVKEGALERLADRPGARRKVVPGEKYGALKQELEEKERALAEQAVELAILRKKVMEIRGVDNGPVVREREAGGHPSDDGTRETEGYLLHRSLCHVED
jgi:transposase-like protein